MPHQVSRAALRVLASVLMTLLLACAAPASAQQRWHWPGAAAATGPATSATPSVLDAGDTGPLLQLEWQAPAYLTWVSNPLAGPAQVRLNAPPSEDYRAVPQLPLTVELAAHERRLLARLYPASNQRTLGGLGLKLDIVPGAPQARAQPVRYQLPFRDVPVQVDQGFGGHFSHTDAPNWYAVDFALPHGTPVLAAREGVVMQVQRDSTEDGPHGPAAGGGNLVRVLHADGSMAVYAHLAPDGVAVRAGQVVAAGERLGSSGNTGFSTAPHLHFALQRNAGMQLISLPFRMMGPQGELQFPSPAP
ncbi:M23 family metallopeptidase [Xanthomonas hortorum]|uniref:M23 family metallopeptidase n=1 Tax=Xanthomonas hortorum TaxID=56454 RepID=UPI0015D5ACDA|nr:M23 family metallopeptidase [Xanthomonas hortorum]MCE4356223.1 M23 family metallopeptidase [Xanthomonas hortorum pv. pelargonii]MCM5526132.1 M23 family metallopeptidase [Xanthomonas hortorum pv. pelargonii]MCM5538323.1 M23 family metallopeptidase [Xanthomonas hortorum pv. pelargonii]MCM5542503.1 M23 family metallopeptidase [Xanthomonas hortorum pv. pelargonii]MCM5546302.1 M23 family metallopeptidase [Xanthomonas hortorum pv. pelargonii]